MSRLLPLNSSIMPIFNFSVSKAINILEEHSVNDQIFGFKTETTIIAIYAILMAAGLCSNLMVCSVVLGNRRIRGSRNALVINLNVSDLLLCVFCMPFTLLVLIRRSWILGDVLCKLVPFMQASTVFVSAATVSAISVDRCKVVLSFDPQRARRPRNQVVLNTIVIWTSSLLLSLPMCIFRRTLPVGLHGLHIYYKCVEKWPSYYYKGAYTVVILIAQFVVPAVILLVTHLQIRFHLNSRIFKSSCDSEQIEDSASCERLQRDLKRNARATMVLLSIFVIFTVSWLPWNTLNILVDFHPYILSPGDMYLAFAICHIIAMTSSVSNPIVYGWLNSNIRGEMVRLGLAVAKAGSALMSSRSSHTDNLVVQQGVAVGRSSGNDSCSGRKETECPV